MTRATRGAVASTAPSAPESALVGARARSLLPLPRRLSGLPVVRELRWFWPIYLWHHRRGWTRRLHHVGSWACIAGALLAIVLGGWWLLPAGLAVGYLCAFTGHWVVERNRPLTFGRPVLAGICNWIMFTLELTGGLHMHLQVVEEESEEEWDEVDVISQ